MAIGSTHRYDLARVHEVKVRIGDQPRVGLAQLPTPLEEMPNLSAELGLRVLLKRDDQTGLALGGNKARKLEFVLAHAMAQGADTIVTTGGSQSNHARMTAAACRKLGLDCCLVLDRGLHPENGNLLLDELFGATVELLDSQDPVVAAERMQEAAADFRARGKRPYVVPRGGSVPVGATGYVNAAVELADQLRDESLEVDTLYLATGSCGTHAGIIAGFRALDLPTLVQGISVSRSSADQESRVTTLANATLAHLGLDAQVDRDRVRVDDRFVGDGYGHPTRAMWEAVKLVARTDGIIVDPVYTGKAMAGLLEHARSGKVPKGDTIIFLHTGGGPALFAYSRDLEAML